MYNQLLSSTALFNSQSLGIGSPKFASQKYPKVLDKTMPTPTLRHYSSNPNISLDQLQPRPSHHQMP